MDSAPAASAPRAYKPITPMDETRWSQITRLSDRGDTPEERRAWSEAWDYLFATFRPALENQVRRVLRRNGFPEDECEDVVQDFWAKCLEKDWLTKADRAIGKFRTFAYVCVRRHCQRVVEARRAKRRTPGNSATVAGSTRVRVSPDAQDPEFTESWRARIFDLAIERVAMRSPDNAAYLRVWRLGEADAGLIGDNRAWRARKMLQQELERVVLQSTSSRECANQELRELDLEPGYLPHGRQPDGSVGLG